LGVSVELVRQVAAATAYGEGEEPPTRRLVSVLIAHAEELDDNQLEVVLATVRALRRYPANA